MIEAAERFRAALRREREAQGLTLTQLAELMGAKRQHVGRLENGDKSPTLTTVQRAADALRVDPVIFLMEGER